jgi:twitching motility two-component system response regulator PilH
MATISRIMIVDDSATDRFYLSEILTRNGFTVTQAETGEEALDRVRAELPDLVLMTSSCRDSTVSRPRAH